MRSKVEGNSNTGAMDGTRIVQRGDASHGHLARLKSFYALLPSSVLVHTTYNMTHTPRTYEFT